MSHRTLRLEREEAVVVVAVHRPERRNALNAAVRAELLDAVAVLTADPAVRVLVLTGSGDQVFVAGADLAEFAARARRSSVPRWRRPACSRRWPSAPNP